MAISRNKEKMPLLPPEKRARTFEEVALGYTEEQALSEASRCLNCRTAPCVSGCPVGVRIPDFIGRMKEGDWEGAYRILAESTSLPAVCGRVCPQETQCESRCTLGRTMEPVGIGRLERFAADRHMASGESDIQRPASNGHRVAVVGSGPSGLTCAGDLARKGYDVTVFEALHVPGGVLSYGIPEFRLPKEIVAREIRSLSALGVKIETNVIIGKTLTVDELFGEDFGFEAVFLGTGAGLPNFMGIPGESLNGVCSANEFLTRSNLMHAYREDADTPIRKGGKTVVVGGGNVAMDAARTALRLGAESVTVVYRRSLEELPARKEEVEHAEEEGVVFRLLCNPVSIEGYSNPDHPKDPKNGSATGVRCVRMELGEPDESGRRRPVPVPGSEFLLEADTVIIAIGTSPNPLIKSTTEGLEVNRRGGIVVTEEGETSRKGVFAGGDAVTGAATVISAMGAGKTAASAIDRYLTGSEEPWNRY
ncbi:MAG: NADPH-dependent glutamate synthase [Clostridia bacterium]|nr:NADPH-dependent glutamate synthase [Clostridia bacterium]